MSTQESTESCSSTEFITWVGLMLSVHGKNGMHLIFLGNLVLKCFLQESQDIQPYSDNQIKEIEKRCIQNSEHMEISPAYVGCKALNQDIWGICKSQQWKNFFFFRRISHSIYCCWTTRVRQTKIKGWERNCKSNQFFNCRSEKQSLLAFSEEGAFDCK